jgi:ribosomal protein L22
MGRASKIHNDTSHVTLVVSDEAPAKIKGKA